MSMCSTRPLLVCLQLAVVLLCVIFNPLSKGEASPKSAFNESFTENEFVVSHSIPWQVRRKFVKVISTQSKGQESKVVRRQSNFKNNSTIGHEDSDSDDFIRFDDDSEPETNELEYMMVQESSPIVGVSHMPVVEIMEERPRLTRRPPSRTVDHPVFMPMDVMPALNLQIDTLGVGGNFNGQTNLRIQSSTPSLSTLFDIIPTDAMAKGIPMEVKASAKQQILMPKHHHESKDATASLTTEYNYPPSSSSANYPADGGAFTEVKRIKRKRTQRKRTKVQPGYQYYSNLEEHPQSIGTQSTINQEIADGQGESDYPPQNTAKGLYQSHYQSHQFQQQPPSLQQIVTSDVHPRGSAGGGHPHQSTYDSFGHPVRRLERKNNQFDHLSDPGTDPRFSHLSGDAGIVTSNVGTISESGIGKNRGRNTHARITGPQLDVDDQDSFDFPPPPPPPPPVPLPPQSSIISHGRNPQQNPPLIVHHHHHSEEDNSDEVLLKYLRPSVSSHSPRGYNRNRYSHSLEPHALPPQVSPVQSPRSATRDIRSSASSSLDSNHGDNGINSLTDEEEGDFYEPPPPKSKEKPSKVPKTKNPEMNVNLIPKQHIHNSGLWNYEDEDKWGKRFPSCEGMAQSPINIETNSITDDSNLSVELMPSYNSKISVASLVNTGLTLEILHVNGPRPTITGSAVYEDVFAFHKLHFHWGSKNSIGSEHAIFDQKFPMEMHLVHYNDKYESIEKAITKPDGLCVIAVFFQVTKQDNPRFDSLMKSLKRVTCGGNSVPFNGLLNLTNFLPSNHNEFYRYQGSLTTPPCTESVVWLILRHGLLIGKNQLKKFRELKQFDCATPIMNNWRNVQSVNGRRVDRAIRSK